MVTNSHLVCMAHFKRFHCSYKFQSTGLVDDELENKDDNVGFAVIWSICMDLVHFELEKVKKLFVLKFPFFCLNHL